MSTRPATARAPGVWRVAAALLALLTAAPAPTRAAAVETPPTRRCDARPDGVFIIAGHLDAEMAACVAARLPAQVREVIVDSDGGEVTSALDIAERLRGRGLTLRVRRQCNSSCANYLVPIAARLVVEPGSTLLLHGGADPAFLAKIRSQRAQLLAASRAQGASAAEAERRYRRLVSDTQANIARQRDFIAAQGVRPGWLIYRTADRPGADRNLTGATDPPLDQARAVLVEEAFLRSCLPHLEVEPFQADIERQYADPRRSAWLRKIGVVRSASLRCTPAT